MTNNSLQQDIDDQTKEHFANALWMSKYDESKIPAAILKKFKDPKNTNSAIGQRTNVHLDWLLQRPQSFNPDYTKRYKMLKKHCQSLSPRQAYVFASKFLGLNGSQGFDKIPAEANLEFMRDHMPKPRSQVGWHFFIGSAWGEDGQEYGIECMFFRFALLPPRLAKELGLSEQDNQVVELQLSISVAGKLHYQADPVVVSGTSGLIDWKSKPFSYSLGKNKISSSSKDKLWPLSVQAWGIDKNPEKNIELSIDLEFTSGKEYLLQGDNGAMPSLDGWGTLYYSIPNIILKAGSSISVAGKKIKLKKGAFWFDHQWGFLTGNTRLPVLRASGNIGKPLATGWDWYMAQFDGDRQITMFAGHTKALKDFYFRDGDKPPGLMQVDVAGKYMDENKKLHNTWGTLKVTRWVRAEKTPNPNIYPATHTWHPCRWEFSFDDTMPKDIRKFSMTPVVEGGQINFFANGSQYNEGAVILKNKNGIDIGRGFAEAVQYADTIKNSYAIAGITDAQDQKLLENNGDSLFGRAHSLIYIVMHQKELKSALAKSRGLEFFSKPKSK